VQWVQENFPHLPLVVLPKNYGFAQGYNEAFQILEQRQTWDYYLLLNSDVEVAPDWLAPLIDFLQQNPTYAAVQPKIRAHANPQTFEYAGAAGGYLDPWGFPFCRGRIFDSVETDRGQYDMLADVFWTSGAAMLVRSRLYHQVGGLDGDFFAHMEEIDLCWRLQNAGYKLACEPKSTVFHIGGGTLSYQSPFKTYLNFRNSLVMLFKNAPAKNLFFRIYFRMLLDGIAGVRFFLQAQPRQTWAIIKAHFYLYQNLPQLLKKRKAVQAIAPARTLPTLYNKSIVWQYFVRKKKLFSESV
jgi:GT2 family glycosyltransferase